MVLLLLLLLASCGAAVAELGGLGNHTVVHKQQPPFEADTAASAVPVPAAAAVVVFQHPAGWHTKADIARIRAQIASGKEPWASARTTALMNYSVGEVPTVGYKASPVEVVHRDCCNRSGA